MYSRMFKPRNYETTVPPALSGGDSRPSGGIYEKNRELGAIRRRTPYVPESPSNERGDRESDRSDNGSDELNEYYRMRNEDSSRNPERAHDPRRSVDIRDNAFLKPGSSNFVEMLFGGKNNRRNFDMLSTPNQFSEQLSVIARSNKSLVWPDDDKKMTLHHSMVFEVDDDYWSLQGSGMIAVAASTGMMEKKSVNLTAVNLTALMTLVQDRFTAKSAINVSGDRYQMPPDCSQESVTTDKLRRMVCTAYDCFAVFIRSHSVVSHRGSAEKAILNIVIRHGFDIESVSIGETEWKSWRETYWARIPWASTVMNLVLQAGEAEGQMGTAAKYSVGLASRFTWPLTAMEMAQRIGFAVSRVGEELEGFSLAMFKQIERGPAGHNLQREMYGGKAGEGSTDDFVFITGLSEVVRLAESQNHRQLQRLTLNKKALAQYPGNVQFQARMYKLMKNDASLAMVQTWDEDQLNKSRKIAGTMGTIKTAYYGAVGSKGHDDAIKAAQELLTGTNWADLGYRGVMKDLTEAQITKYTATQYQPRDFSTIFSNEIDRPI